MNEQPPPSIASSLFRYDQGVRAIALGLRQVVVDELAPCHEYIFAMRSKLMLLYGSSEKVIADCVCSIAVFRRHATLSFHHGVDLPDAYGMLQGHGKALRHIRIEHLSDLDRQELRFYLREARKRSNMKSRRGTDREVITRVKSSPVRKQVEHRRMF